MKKGQIYEGIVERLNFPNKGIVISEGEEVLVKNCIPGQKIRFRVSQKRKGKYEGRLVDVIEKSPLETRDKACSIFGDCGGCNYQTISYEEQLELKKKQVIKLLDGVCSDYEFEGILASPKEWNYRNKMEYSFGDDVKDGPLTLGFHKRGSFYDILTAGDCALVDDDYNKVLECILDYFTELDADYYHKMTRKGYLRHLLVRRAAKTGELLVNIVTTSQEDDLINKLRPDEDTDVASDEILDDKVKSQKFIYDPLIKRLLELKLSGSIGGVLHTYNDSVADVVQSDYMILLHGQDNIYEEVLGLVFKISVFSFFQTNTFGAEVLYRKVREYVGDTKDKQIFDLYCGTGTIAQLLAPVAKKVVGVEIVEEAVEAAKENAFLNNLGNCKFIVGDVLKVMDELKDEPDIIVVDPPRDGIHPKAIKKIIDCGVDKIVYVSCKPTSLVRDLKILQEAGYKVDKVCCVDMFPQTPHVECVVLMSKVED